ncbi:MAG: hypothetical protein AAF533_03810 [Acidobacteriota bacterium]
MNKLALPLLLFLLAAPLARGGTLTWTAGSDGNWSDAGNWTLTDGSDEDGIPDAGDVAVFDASSGSEATLGGDLTVYRLEITADYPGVVRLGSNTLSIGAPGAVGARLTVANAAALDATAAKVVSNGAVFDFGGTIGEFEHREASCTLLQDLNVAGDVLLINVANLVDPGALRVAGNVTNEDTNGWGGAGRIKLVGDADQTLDGAGTWRALDVEQGDGARVLLPSDLILVSDSLGGDGHLVNAGGRLVLTGSSTRLDFAGVVDDFEVRAPAAGGNSICRFDQDLNVTGHVLLNSIQNIVGPGALRAAGDITNDDADGWGGTGRIKLVGDADQTLDGAGRWRALDVEQGDGARVLLPSDLILISDSLGGDGHLVNAGGRLVLTGSSTRLDFAGVVDDFEVRAPAAGGNSICRFDQDLNVTGHVLLNGIHNIVGPGALRAEGNITNDDADGWNGDGRIKLVGDADQTLDGAGRWRALDVEQGAGARVLMASDLILASDTLTGDGHLVNAGGRLVVSGIAGTAIDFAGSVDDMEIRANLDGAGTTFMLNQDLNVTGDLLLANVHDIRAPGALRVAGDVQNDDTNGHIGFIKLVGDGDQALTGAGLFSGLDLAKLTGEVVLDDFEGGFGNIEVSAGTWSPEGTITANTFRLPGGTIGGDGTLDGNVTVNAGGTLAPGASPGLLTVDGNLTFQAGSTLSIDILSDDGPGVGHDQVAVTGNLNLGGATLQVGITGPTTGPLTIISFDACCPTASRFDGAPNEGDPLVGGTVSYAGGDGNDIVLADMPGPEQNCHDDIDDNGDGNTDCEDVACANDEACLPESACADEVDNDFDAATDCDDPDCAASSDCIPEAECADGLDDDGDGDVDCDDDECDEDPACIELTCDDGVDNDTDGVTDCDDADCVGTPACIERDCSDGIDDDGDGDTDCADADCSESDDCVEVACADAVDEDFDGLTDCDDVDCLRSDDCADHDWDGDTVPNGDDNCAGVPNPHQEDVNGNTVGEICETVFQFTAEDSSGLDLISFHFFVEGGSGVRHVGAVRGDDIDPSWDCDSPDLGFFRSSLTCTNVFAPLGAVTTLRFGEFILEHVGEAPACDDLTFAPGAPNEWLDDSLSDLPPEAITCEVINCLPGDVHPDEGDGRVSLADYVAGFRKVVGLTPLLPRDVECGDVHPGTVTCDRGNQTSDWCVEGDGHFALGDLLVIRRLIQRVYVYGCDSCLSAEEPVVSWVPGDVTPRDARDGVVDISDVVLSLRVAVGLDHPSDDEQRLLDVAPVETAGGRLLARGDETVDIADVVALLRVAVGIDELAWPERELSLVLTDSPAPAVAFAQTVEGWPSWATVTAWEAGPCSLDGDAEATLGDEAWLITCVTDPEPFAAPAELVRVTYTGPGVVDPTELTSRLELLDEGLDEIAGQVELLD